MGVWDDIKEKVDDARAFRRSQNARYLAYHETEIAKSVFEDTVPYERVIIGDGIGYGNRPYTMPVPGLPFTSRKYYIQCGDGYYGMSRRPEDKKTLVHELTHVWQGEHSHWAWSYVFSSAIHQTGDAYAYDPKNMKDWDDYNPEQQAQIIEDWFGAGADDDDYRYHYVVEDIRGKMMAPKIETHEDIPESYQISAQDSNVPISDDYIVDVLSRRYAANDVAGFGGRVKQLQRMFSQVEVPRAKGLLMRLSVRRSGDKMSMLFHDNLSTATRNSLLDILRKR